MNLHLKAARAKIFFLFCIFSSIWLISCGMRTAPVFIPNQKAKQTVTDLKVQQRDNRVRLSWKINHSERLNRLKQFDEESRNGDYFIIHQKLIQLDCKDCDPEELPDLKVMILSDSMIHDGNQVFFYLQLPEKGLKFNSYKISHYGPDDEIISQSQSIRLRRSNLFPTVPSPELEVVQIEDQSQIIRFPFGKVVQQKKIGIASVHKIEQMKEKEKKDKNDEFTEKIKHPTEYRVFTLRISWPKLLNQSLKSFTGKGGYFEGDELYRIHLYRTLNVEKWPENPINIKSPSDNYFLDILKIQITPPTPPILVDTHPDILPHRILFYIDLSVKYVDTWHYKLRLVDRFGNESDASESVSFDLPKTTILANNFVKMIFVPHTD